MLSSTGHRFIALSKESKDLNIIVVDIGYSAKRRTCGISWSDDKCEKYQFGEAIRCVAEQINNYKIQVIVLEAVLSTYHVDNGNPDIRGDFERGRGWYFGAGVLTFAAAKRFLSELVYELEKDIYLAEAFLSRQGKNGSHCEDAKLIRKEFWKTQPAELKEKVKPSSSYVNGVPPVRVFSYKNGVG